VITRQLMRTARTLEAEWRKVTQGSMSAGAKKMNQVLGTFGLLDFTMLHPILASRTF
jgi:hypothetical protein